ncbi:hypothetical protein U1Q18_003482, partial [Sarracenia purpurea var. burkii]
MHENSGPDAGAVSIIQEPREQGDPPEVLEQGSNLGDIGTAYAKDNMENTEIEDIPAMPTFHRKGKPSHVSYNKPLVGPKAKNKFKEFSKKEKKMAKAKPKKEKGKLSAGVETKV